MEFGGVHSAVRGPGREEPLPLSLDPLNLSRPLVAVATQLHPHTLSEQAAEARLRTDSHANLPVTGECGCS